MDLKTGSLKLHAANKGKLSTEVTTPIKNMLDMTLVYTPGVTEIVAKAVAEAV